MNKSTYYLLLHRLVSVLIFILPGTTPIFAQLARLRDDVYMRDESSMNVALVDISRNKIKFKNEINKTKKVKSNEVLMVFNKVGEFMIYPNENINIAAARAFIHSSTLPKSDIIITTDQRSIFANINQKQEEVILYNNIEKPGPEQSISKNEVAAIFYKNGSHELLINPSEAAKILKTQYALLLNFRKTGAIIRPKERQLPVSISAKGEAPQKMQHSSINNFQLSPDTLHIQNSTNAYRSAVTEKPIIAIALEPTTLNSENKEYDKSEKGGVNNSNNISVETAPFLSKPGNPRLSSPGSGEGTEKTENTSKEKVKPQEATQGTPVVSATPMEKANPFPEEKNSKRTSAITDITVEKVNNDKKNAQLGEEPVPAAFSEGTLKNDTHSDNKVPALVSDAAASSTKDQKTAGPAEVSPDVKEKKVKVTMNALKDKVSTSAHKLKTVINTALKEDSISAPTGEIANTESNLLSDSTLKAAGVGIEHSNLDTLAASSLASEPSSTAHSFERVMKRDEMEKQDPANGIAGLRSNSDKKENMTFANNETWIGRTSDSENKNAGSKDNHKMNNTHPKLIKDISKEFPELDEEHFQNQSLYLKRILEAYMALLLNKNTSDQEAQKIIQEATLLFVTDQSWVEISNNGGRNYKVRFKIKDFLQHLRTIRYNTVAISWVNANYVQNIGKGPDGSHYGLITLQQKLNDFKEGTAMASASYKKNNAILLKNVESASKDPEVMFSDIGVIVTKNK